MNKKEDLIYKKFNEKGIPSILSYKTLLRIAFLIIPFAILGIFFFAFLYDLYESIFELYQAPIAIFGVTLILSGILFTWSGAEVEKEKKEAIKKLAISFFEVSIYFIVSGVSAFVAFQLKDKSNWLYYVKSLSIIVSMTYFVLPIFTSLILFDTFGRFLADR